MDLLATFLHFVEANEGGERAAFEAAMEERIRTKGYKMSDLMFEVFVCQRNMALLSAEVDHLKARLNKKKAG